MYMTPEAWKSLINEIACTRNMFMLSENVMQIED